MRSNRQKNKERWLKARLNRVFDLMRMRRAAVEEIREILKEVDHELVQEEDGEETLRCAREYFVVAMEKLLGGD